VLISPRYRIPAWVLVGLCWAVTITLGARYAGTQHAGWLDTVLIQQIHTTVGDQNWVAQLLVSPSSPLMLCAVVVLSAVLGLAAGRWEFALLAVVAPLLALAIVELVGKPMADRRMAGYLSYPSGHTVCTLSVLTVAMLGLAAGPSIGRRVMAILVWIVISGAVMVGLVAMDYHYPTDTFAGLGVALGIVLPLAMLADAMTVRRYRRSATIRR
jgi:undecaprenyl-diphosphatase